MELQMWKPGANDGTRDAEVQRRGPAAEEDMKFTPQPMVQWLDPRQLAGTAVRSLLSTVFGSYADRRETEAALKAGRLHDFSDAEDMWIDYTADAGDGFDSTYTVANLLAKPALRLGDADRMRGRILVLGGDQIYPTPSRDEYRNRFTGPYEAALPSCADNHPYMFVIPGNHDWYDGLASFLRLFCQKRWIGGWRTAQTRSYFALKLPHNWWLLGTDFQLHSDVDQPQIDYFCAVAKHMQPGDRNILCTPEPTWVGVGARADAFDNLAFFEKQVLAESGAVVAVTLAGDLHHYARYQSTRDDEQRITAGGGGAYLYPTQNLPKSVRLRHDDRVETEWTQQATFPARNESRSRRPDALFAFRKNPRFSAIIAGLYAVYAWVLQSASKTLAEGSCDFMECVAPIQVISWSGLPQVLQQFGRVLVHAPLLVLLTVGIIGALTAFCTPDPDPATGTRRSGLWKGLGVLHGALHVLLAVVLTWILARINTGNTFVPVVLDVDSLWQPVLFLVQMMVVGGVLGGVLFGLFLLPGVNQNEAYSAQHIEDFKNFVRLHIDRSGVLTIYPVGIRRAAKWKFRPDAPPGEPWFEPDGAAPQAHLIEQPVRVETIVPRWAYKPAGEES